MALDGNEVVKTEDLKTILGDGRSMPVVLYSDPTMMLRNFENYNDVYEVTLSQPVSNFTTIAVLHFSAYSGMGTMYYPYVQVYPAAFLTSSGTYHPKLTTTCQYNEVELTISASGNLLQVTKDTGDDWSACIYMVIGIK